MPVDLFGANEQSAVEVDLDRWLDLARKVLADQGITDGAELSVLFVDEPTIAELNEQFLGKTGPTDVLSFPIEDDLDTSGRSPDQGGSGPGTEAMVEPQLLLGDVVICPTIAERNATDHGHDAAAETALLVVHGILHLLGFDHEVEAEAEVMEALERRLLTAHYDPTWAAAHPS